MRSRAARHGPHLRMVVPSVFCDLLFVLLFYSSDIIIINISSSSSSSSMSIITIIIHIINIMINWFASICVMCFFGRFPFRRFGVALLLLCFPLSVSPF